MMKSKLKKMAISFAVMIIVNFVFTTTIFWDLGLQFPHVGLLFVFGLIFGPYGALGAVLANVVLDVMTGFTPIEIIPSAVFSFGVSYLAYKLWYSGFENVRITKPRLDNISHLIQFLTGILICGLVYSVAHGILVGFFFGPSVDEEAFLCYFMNFINIAFVFGIVGIWLSRKIDLIETPKTSKRPANERLYNALFYLLLAVTIISTITLLLHIDRAIVIGELATIGILLFAYLTKPFKYQILPANKNTVIEKIIRNFIIITLTIAILGIVVSILSYNFVEHIHIEVFCLHLMPALIITDTIILLFFIPGIIILRYIDSRVIKPISSFSEIEGFISENEKIEAEGLVNVYSQYVNEKNEIGTLARSYTELIKHNNNYIENIREIEGEKERINAELDIATRIQASALPTEALENDDFIVNGYSHPAKEVGGDFFDYYMIDDDNLAIVIGDASGKGIPAAIVAMITQVMIKQMLKHYQDPSKTLYLINNQLFENNHESMFVTLWLGIYNRTNKKLTFSNAGHNQPLIKENNGFEYIDIDFGVVLGIMDEFDYVNEERILESELVLYTDGITDTKNKDNNRYGKDRLLNFLNGFESDTDPIMPLLNDVYSFSENIEQFDDMTLLYLKIKDD